MVIDPTARRVDGESVRIARDVLCAGASDDVKVCVLDQPQAMPRALARRKGRQVVVVGDDRALLRAVRLLHREGALGARPLGLVPVGAPVAVARALGVPTDAVAASRAVLAGHTRRLDVLTDDAGGVVLGGLGIPAPAAGPPIAAWRRAVPFPRPRARAGERLRVEADGRVLADLDRPVAEVSVRPADGLADVVVRSGRPEREVRARASSVTVFGSTGFSYRANAVNLGPTRARTWTVRPGALRLTVPIG
ncbi:diacylglycerol kinase family protein [Streptomyces sp. DSM 44915]|uniref:Diacylglycerol kinase family protein n=1 Tax=Streptomyces chisholmiae TaxID=3075540 RepID=A0ABU2JYL9_9ACTN|nr:diacylglycerol kinase family protein [Streptomyces sp. DSM 44915]MDT0270105.1 diacylglycerol kinase family protein [Streptomyces sp. DSM 44915]